jgi:hypothetical protein
VIAFGLALVVLFAMGYVLGEFVTRRRSLQAADEMIQAHIKLFPNACPLCSFDRYGRSMGYEVIEKPHPCPERHPELAALRGRS